MQSKRVTERQPKDSNGLQSRIGVRVACQLWIPAGGQSSLQMHTATTESVSLCVPKKCWGRLLNHSGTLRGLMIVPRELFFCTKVIVKENVAAFVVIAFPENNFRGAVIIVVSRIH